MVVAGSMTEDYVPGCGSSAVDGSTSLRHCRSMDSLGEWRSCEQVDNGTPSTSPPHWDSDDDDDSGPKPCDLYGKFTWKIEHFSQLNKKELRSNAFEVGGYKWYILIYPQGCDACNHLSLFLCVANHDKLLPGWSHFALFTIAVVNKDPKKNKYNDTLHRFWKKEHDWGWKKFMELNKVVDGFVDDDILTIKAQVQVIRENAHRPFRCLDIQYRRELIRVYLSAVEQTCARFVEERKKKLQTWIDDKAQWSSFHSFWFGIDPNTRRLMSRDKTDVILKIVVKHFFIEKEVASTLVMDSLYTGLRVLESQSKLKKLRADLLEKEESPAPLIFIEDDMFVLADDVFLLLERTALESAHLPSPSKEEKGLPSRTKDGCSGDELSRDSVLRDERRLTELGRRTLEIFIFAHIFSSRIEIAYKETVALKRQEELIREEEEAEQAENEKREKRAMKKQARQRRNNRKGKDRGKDEKSMGTMKEKHALQDSHSDDRILEDFSEHGLRVNEKSDMRREDASDPGDDGAEALRPDAVDRDTSPLSWDTDTSETHPAAEPISNSHVEKKSSSFVDDSSSTCSTDSVPSVVVNGPYKGYSSSNTKNKRNSSNRGKKQQNKDMRHNSTSNADRLLYVSGSCNATGPEPEGNLHSFMDKKQSLELLPIKKEKVDMKQGTKVIVKDQIDEEIPSKSKSTTTESVFPSANLNRKPLPVKPSTERHTTATTNIEWVPTSEVTSNTPIQSEKSVRLLVKSPQNLSISKSEDLKNTSQAMTSTTHQASSMSRPSSAPIIPVPMPAVPLVSPSQTMPLLTHTLSSNSCLDFEPSFSAQTFEPQSYRNAIMGIRTATGTSTSGFTPQSSSNSSTQPTAFAHPSSSSSSSSSLSSHPSQAAARKDRSSFNHGIIFGSRRSDVLHNPHQRTDQFHSHVNDNMRISNNYESVISLHQSQGVIPDEFPHLDIINDLLDDDHRMVGRATFDGYHHHDDFHSMNQQHAFQGDLVTTDTDYLNASCQFDLPDYYYDELSQMVHDSYVPFHGIGDMQPLPLDFSVYGSGMDALRQNHWPIFGADLSVPNFGNAVDVNGYPYQLPEYSTCLGGYNMMYQPANGL